ncbi:MAG: amino acid permease [Actinobacteria bacterium]|nr:MAG: amino acid permease [Actinomycetota bacterium]
MATTEPQHDQHARDAADLARFGYKQELKRTLGVFSSFAVAFSYISPSTGIFTLYFLALSIGGAMFWTWPVVAFGQLLIALNWAELSSHYPIAGSVFQWTKYLSGRTYAWFTGWIYLFAGIITVAAVVATLPLALIPALNSMFGSHLNNTLGSSDQRTIALITLVVITVLNIYGVRLVAIVNNTGVIFEILGMVVFAFVLALFHNHQGVGVIFKTGGAKLNGSTFLIAMFMSLFVIYGFDTASTLAEETKDPRREAPKAVLASIIGAFVIGAIFLWGTLMAIPSMKDAINTSNFVGPQTIIEANLSSAFATVYLLVVSAAIFVCCMSIMTSTVRLCFGMSRDDQLPAAKSLARVSPRLHTPIWSCIVVALFSAIPFIQFAGATIIAVSATAMIYLSYFLGGIAVLRARSKGWPRVKAPFSLGKWGVVVNVLGLVWGGAMLVNFLTPAKNTDSLRVFSNPKANQTGGLVNFHVAFLNKIPVIELVMVAVIVVGAVYYFGFQRRKPFTPVIPPEEVTEAAR